MGKKGFIAFPSVPGVPGIPSVIKTTIPSPPLPQNTFSVLPSAIVKALLDSSGNISDLEWTKNRPPWKMGVKRYLGENAPDPKLVGKRTTTVAEGIDRRHIISNEMIKEDIKTDFSGKSPQEAESILDGLGYKGGSLDDKFSRYYSARFNDPENLWLGDAEANQSLGRMIGLLKNKVEAGPEKFEPFEIDMAKYGIPDYTWKIDSFNELRQAYFNANVDFSSYPGTNIGTQLEPSEATFQKIYPKIPGPKPPDIPAAAKRRRSMEEESPNQPQPPQDKKLRLKESDSDGVVKSEGTVDAVMGDIEADAPEILEAGAMLA